MSNGVLEVSNDNFESEVVNSEKPVLVDFWAQKSTSTGFSLFTTSDSKLSFETSKTPLLIFYLLGNLLCSVGKNCIRSSSFKTYNRF